MSLNQQPVPESAAVVVPDVPPHSDKTRDVRWSRWANQTAVISGVVAAIVSIGAFWVSTKGYLDRRVEMAVNRRLAIYENLASGLNFNQVDDYDSALPVFHTAMQDPRFASSTSETQNLVRDGLLYAIVNCEQPLKYGGDIASMEKRFGNDLPETAWRQQQFGWYYLRTGRPDIATKHFDRALQLYRLASDWRGGGNPLRGIMFVRSVAGDLSGARAAASEAKVRDPSLFPTAIPAEIDSLRHENWYLKMEALYGDPFKKTMALLAQP